MVEKDIPLTRLVSLICGALLLASCATEPPREAPAPVSERTLGGAPAPEADRRPPQQPPPAAPRSASPAVTALLADAKARDDEGDHPQAVALLERAQRIEPQNAVVWHRLAQVRFHQGELEQAESLAAKSNSLAGGNRRLRARNWRLIANVRTQWGDHTGAEEALQKARAAEP